jgi:hypothetical protein
VTRHLWRCRMIDDAAIRLHYEALEPVLDEQGLRRFAAAQASAAGHGRVMREHGANTGSFNPTPADRCANGNGEILARRFERGHVAPPRRAMNVGRFAKNFSA